MADFLTLLATKLRKGANVASAATITIPTTGDRFDITGTTGITAMTTTGRGIGSRFYLRFSGIVTITNGANVVLNGGTNITTAAASLVLFEVIGTNQVQQITPYGVAGATGAAGTNGTNGTNGADGPAGSSAPVIATTASTGTPTPAVGTIGADILFRLTAQTATAAFANPTGTPIDGQKVLIQIYSAAAQSITWGTSYVARGYALPSTTVAGKWTGVLLTYSAATSKFDAHGGYQEA